MTTTPTTPEGLRRYDHLPAAEAVARWWTDPGVHPVWHRDRQAELRRAMPGAGEGAGPAGGGG